jgi:hypothetical protein
MKSREASAPGGEKAAMLRGSVQSIAMQAPQDSSPELVPLICTSLSGVLLAGLLLASGLAEITLVVPRLVGAGDAPEPAVQRTSQR